MIKLGSFTQPAYHCPRDVNNERARRGVGIEDARSGADAMDDLVWYAAASPVIGIGPPRACTRYEMWPGEWPDVAMARRCDPRTRPRHDRRAAWIGRPGSRS